MEERGASAPSTGRYPVLSGEGEEGETSICKNFVMSVVGGKEGTIVEWKGREELLLLSTGD